MLEFEGIAFVIGGIGLVGGGGLWLGSLHSKVNGHAEEIKKIGDMRERIVRVETICEGIYRKVNGRDPD